MKWWGALAVVVGGVSLLISGAVEIRIEWQKICAVMPIRCGDDR